MLSHLVVRSSALLPHSHPSSSWRQLQRAGNLARRRRVDRSCCSRRQWIGKCFAAANVAPAGCVSCNGCGFPSSSSWSDSDATRCAAGVQCCDYPPADHTVYDDSPWSGSVSSSSSASASALALALASASTSTSTLRSTYGWRRNTIGHDLGHPKNVDCVDSANSYDISGRANALCVFHHDCWGNRPDICSSILSVYSIYIYLPLSSSEDLS